MDYFASRLKYLREERGYTQTQLAKEIGVSKVTICWYENGNRIPSLTNVIKLARILNVSIDYLIGFSIEK